MTDTYRLFLPTMKLLGTPSSVIEWEFTEYDLNFLKHQYEHGVLDRQADKTLSLFIGKTRVHQSPEIGCMFSKDIDINHLEEMLESSLVRKVIPIPKSEMQVHLSIKNGDLLLNVADIGDSSSISEEVSMLDIEDALSLVKEEDPGLDYGWFRSEEEGFALTGQSGPLYEYQVFFEKIVRYKATHPVKVMARSLEDARNLALGYAPELEYKESETDFALTPYRKK